MKIMVNHLGFRPEDTGKTAVVFGEGSYTGFYVIDLNQMGYNEIGPNTKANEVAFEGSLRKCETDMGSYYLADFSELKKPGIYLISINNEFNSVPFQIREDVFSRTIRKPFDYIHLQRCGQEVPGYHGPCHLDDAVRRDDGTYVDTAGGWHDAGDTRKWMAFTMMLGLGITQLKRNMDPDWKTFDRGEGDLLNELRWGNAYFLKMINSEGQIWNDVAAGLDGDNSDNRWTDNIIQSGDERHINTAWNPEVQRGFVYLEALIAQTFKTADPDYSGRCLRAAQKAIAYLEKQTPDTDAKMTAWSILAYKELFKLTGEQKFLSSLKKELRGLLSLQEKQFVFNQKEIRGYFYQNGDRRDSFRDMYASGIVLASTCEAFTVLPEEDPIKTAAREAIGLYCRDYILPLQGKSPYGIIPYGIFAGETSAEKYRTLAGDLKYRFFAPTRAAVQNGVQYLGLTSHLLSHAVGLQMAGRILKDPQMLEIARKQMEWVMGNNPEGACLMTGEGINNPYPHSRFLGLIPGGIMNGFVGLEDDEPFVDMSCGMDWRTTEYWSPHVGFYIWYMSLIGLDGKK